MNELNTFSGAYWLNNNGANPFAKEPKPVKVKIIDKVLIGIINPH